MSEKKLHFVHTWWLKDGNVFCPILLSSSLRPCSASARAASRTVEHSAAVVASKGSVCAARETMAGVDIGSTCDNNRAVAAGL